MRVRSPAEGSGPACAAVVITCTEGSGEVLSVGLGWGLDLEWECSTSGTVESWAEGSPPASSAGRRTALPPEGERAEAGTPVAPRSDSLVLVRDDEGRAFLDAGPAVSDTSLPVLNRFRTTGMRAGSIGCTSAIAGGAGGVGSSISSNSGWSSTEAGGRSGRSGTAKVVRGRRAISVGEGAVSV